MSSAFAELSVMIMLATRLILCSDGADKLVTFLCLLYNARQTGYPDYDNRFFRAGCNSPPAVTVREPFGRAGEIPAPTV